MFDEHVCPCKGYREHVRTCKGRLNDSRTGDTRVASRSFAWVVKARINGNEMSHQSLQQLSQLNDAGNRNRPSQVNDDGGRSFVWYNRTNNIVRST
jgi:hypothetical protein